MYIRQLELGSLNLLAQVKVYRIFYSLLFDSLKHLALLDFLNSLLNLALLDLIILDLYPLNHSKI